MIPNKNTGGYFATHYDEIIHWLMACYAGFGGMYSVVLHARNFVNAQTGNLMSITEDFLGGDFFSVMTRVGALIMFAAGVVVSFLLSQKIQKDMRKIVICVNAVAITLVALMPLTWDPIMTIYPMIFAASFQWGTFSEAQGYASATIFLSNNTKQSVLAWTQFFMTKDWNISTRPFSIQEPSFPLWLAAWQPDLLSCGKASMEPFMGMPFLSLP